MKKTWTPEKPFLTFAAAMFFLQALWAAEPNAPRKDELNEFATRLNLSGLQIQEVERFLKMIEGQARADRERCTGNAQALIAAAEQRQLMEERHLESILELDQMERYQDIKELRKRDWEYLYYREGLLLTASQCVSVRAILDEFTRKRKIMGEEMKNHGDQGGGRENKGPGGEPDGRRRNGSRDGGRRRNAGRHGRRPRRDGTGRADARGPGDR